MQNTQIDSDYLAKRQLKKGTAGWLLLAGLGVSYVISGDFAGWNFGIGQAGWGGFAIAAVLMAIMYFTLVLSLAEMSAAIPAFNGPWVYAAFYLIFIGVHLAGVGEALKAMMVISGLAVFAIIATGVALIGSFDVANLFDMAVTDAAGASTALPLGWYGVWAALPFAMWLFLAVEGVPLAAEEAKNPAKDVPKGIIGAMTFLLFTALIVVVLTAGSAGASATGQSAVPLVDALNANGNSTLATVVNVLGLAGLVASFFSIIYGYSRLVFALSRAGYLPRSLSLTTSRKVPARALIVPGVFGFLVSLSGEGDLILAMAVVGATVSYALMALSHILLRVRQPNMPRPYKTPGGVVTSGIALALSLVALTGVYAFDPRAFNYTLILFVIGGAYYFFYSKHHLVAKTAEEEFDMLAEAESALEADQPDAGVAISRA